MIDRRKFLASIGVMPVFCRWGGAAGVSFDYVGGVDSIDVYRLSGGKKRRVQSVPSQRPSFLWLDENRRLLFALNEINEWQGLPSGSVESYAIQAATGHLIPVNRQALALSATMPRHFAISPDGRHMVVSIYAGGAYNVLPIHSGGQLGRVSQIIKEIGSSIDQQRQTSAHPHSVIFHPSGDFVIGTDLGSDRINVFRFERGRMDLRHRINVQAGSGPAHLWMDEAGSSVFVRHELSPGVTHYRFNAETGRLT